MKPDTTVRKNLIAIARAYARKRKLEMSTVSQRFHGNRRFLTEFASGNVSITVSKLVEMLQAFSEAWPEGLPWPETVPITMTKPPRKSGGKNTTKLGTGAPEPRIF